MNDVYVFEGGKYFVSPVKLFDDVLLYNQDGAWPSHRQDVVGYPIKKNNCTLIVSLTDDLEVHSSFEA